MGTKAKTVLGLCNQARRGKRSSRVSALALLMCLPMLSGCGLLQRFTGGAEAPVDQTFEPVPIDQGVAPDGGEDFAEPLVPAAPQLSAIASAELIQSTDPEERFQQINSSRPDPFATVPIPPPPQVTPPPPAAPTAAPGAVSAPAPAPASPLTTSPPAGTPTATATPGATTTPPSTPGAAPGTPGAAPSTPGAAPGTPGSTPGGIAIAPLPELPQPTAAQAVVVTGVVNVGGRNYAIVQSPEEPTGRYVTVGQRVAGGAVLVKRIDMRGSEPIVVLEQNGVEVSQFVGPPEEPTETASAT